MPLCCLTRPSIGLMMAALARINEGQAVKPHSSDKMGRHNANVELVSHLNWKHLDMQSRISSSMHGQNWITALHHVLVGVRARAECSSQTCTLAMITGFPT